MYIRSRIYFLAAWLYVCVHDIYRRDCVTCYVWASTRTRGSPYLDTVHCCRETDRPVCTYTIATRQTTRRMVRPSGSQLSGRIRRHFIPCKDIAGGSQLSGRIRRHFLPCEDIAGGSQLSGRIRRHFLLCEDIAGGSQLSGGRIIFLPVIRMHFVAYEDVAGGSQLSGGKCFLRGPSGRSLSQVEESLFCA